MIHNHNKTLKTIKKSNLSISLTKNENLKQTKLTFTNFTLRHRRETQN